MHNQSVYIIAEAGVNHNGNLDLAMKLVDVAADSGANAVKFQTFCTELLVTVDAEKAAYQKRETNPDESQYDMLKKLELDRQDHFLLQAYCKKRQIDFLSTPFDLVSADFLLHQLQLSTIKIASGEITNAPLLLKIASAKPNIILSTGMSTLGEIEQALSVITFGYIGSTAKPSQDAFMHAYSSLDGQKLLKQKVTLLHCTSDYPANFSDIHLLAMDTLKNAFGLRVGYSDHSLGIVIPIAAVARGAAIIEKHFTVDKKLPGPDHKASLEPDELKSMVKSIREVELALGSYLKIPTESELATKKIARKSLAASKIIKPGDCFSKHNLHALRPGSGVSPMHYWDYLERNADKNYQVGELIHE